MHISLLHKRGIDFEPERPRYLIAEVNSRRNRITRQVQEFIVNEENAGTSPRRMPFRIAEEMNNGKFPTVHYHPVALGKNAATLVFMDALPGGEIPGEAIEVMDNPYGKSVRIIGEDPEYMGLPLVISKHIGKYALTYGQVPLIDSTKFVHEGFTDLIDKIDAHIPNNYSSAGGHILQLLENSNS